MRSASGAAILGPVRALWLGVGFVGSYLWQLRQRIGHDLALMPGAAVVVEDPLGRVLLVYRADTQDWGLPAGGAEVGGSFVQTALDELREETGLVVAPTDLTPFGSLSEAALSTAHYPNGDVTHYFALLFAATRWTGQLTASEETPNLAFFDLHALPLDLHGATRLILDAYQAFKAGGGFQVH